jgi:hypothetical protein
MVADREIKGSSSGFKCWNTLRWRCRFLIEEDSFNVNSLSLWKVNLYQIITVSRRWKK